MSKTDIYIVGAARTAIGGFGGSLASLRPAELGEIAIREAIARSGLAADQVQHVVLGNVIPSQPSDAYVARVAAVKAGVPVEAPAMTVNRLCGSGLQAIVSAVMPMCTSSNGSVSAPSMASSMAISPSFWPWRAFSM